MDLFSGTLKRPKLTPNRTVTEVDRDRTETETWTEWFAKNRTGQGPPNPTPRCLQDFGLALSYVPVNGPNRVRPFKRLHVQ